MSDYLTLPEFTKQLGAADNLRFEFQIQLIDGKSLQESCYVPLGPAARQQLTQLLQQRARYFYATCRAADRR
jgi:hypothetical protein